MNANQHLESTKTSVLFVDDEEGIRLTLPAILRQQGFEVSVAESVAQALEIMNQRNFDILLTDLNIGSPADGFLLVSAMRRIHPKAATFILTGYPDFQTALEAIRKQVDDYFTKPADIPSLVSALRQKIHNPRACAEVPCKHAATIILEHSDEIIERWLEEIDADPRSMAIRITKEERIDRFPLLLNDLANALQAGKTQVPAESLNTAAVHGADRALQGYTIPLLVTETRILNRVIGKVLQECLLVMNLSALIPDALRIGEYLQALLEESIRAFQDTRYIPQPANPSSAARGARVKAKAS